MKKFQSSVLIVAVLLACFLGGCGKKSYSEMVESHAAMKTYRDGVWQIRYISEGGNAVGEEMTEITVYLSVDAGKEMTEGQMLEVMDYYEFTRNALFDKSGAYKGERKSDYVCYAVFYEGDTDKEIRRIKYQNGKEAEVTEEDSSMFPLPGMRTDKVGTNP